MAVIEGIMALFVKEVVSSDRVVAAVRNFAEVSANECNLPNDPEQALLLWVTKACGALTKRVASAATAQPNNTVSHLHYSFIISYSLTIHLLSMMCY